jgi:hypothetical protein
MARTLKADVDHVNVRLDDRLHKALERHRKRLAKERGVDVSRSDAMRDAILRTEGA